MPYIIRERRDRFEEDLHADGSWGLDCNTPGELNYLFTLIAVRYFKNNPTYQGINDIVGALEGAKLEFYRRAAVPYENGKILTNGDVYPVTESNPSDL